MVDCLVDLKVSQMVVWMVYTKVEYSVECWAYWKESEKDALKVVQ